MVVAEKIDRISRLPLSKAELLVATIRAKGARVAVPGIVDLTDLTDLVADSPGVTRIVLKVVQDMLLRVALQTARDDYENRRERECEGIEIAKRAGPTPAQARHRSTPPHRRVTRNRHEHRPLRRAHPVEPIRKRCLVQNGCGEGAAILFLLLNTMACATLMRLFCPSRGARKSTV